jgi:hypothetical protein
VQTSPVQILYRQNTWHISNFILPTYLYRKFCPYNFARINFVRANYPAAFTLHSAHTRVPFILSVQTLPVLFAHTFCIVFLCPYRRTAPVQISPTSSPAHPPHKLEGKMSSQKVGCAQINNKTNSHYHPLPSIFVPQYPFRPPFPNSISPCSPLPPSPFYLLLLPPSPQPQPAYPPPWP